ncbi:MAG: hypothetical protein K6G68_02040 [Oscillospiraceae bacterium]|jgi:hypothetical protein|nr:hypothetical protein [Oscillospiraceae bacterium]MCR5805794.1 hypothetical protein [Oscillospiraceae bacterium]
MAKKGIKIAATYFITFFVTLVIIGGVGFVIMNRYAQTQAAKNSDTTETDLSYNEEDMGMTVLGVYDGAERESGVCFYIFHLSGIQEKLYVMPLHADLAVGSQTLYSLYREGGVTAVQGALSGALKLNVEKYIMITGQGFNNFSEACGNISYVVPYNLLYSGEDESIIVKEGEQILDTKNLRKVLTFPEYKDGEEERVHVMGGLAVDLINNGCTSTFRSNLDDVYESLINAGSITNISEYDFNDIQPATKHIIRLNSAPATLLLPSGSYDENGHFVMDSGFIDSLPSRFDK